MGLVFVFPFKLSILYFLDTDERTEKFKAGMHKQETSQNYLTF